MSFKHVLDGVEFYKTALVSGNLEAETIHRIGTGTSARPDNVFVYDPDGKPCYLSPSLSRDLMMQVTGGESDWYITSAAWDFDPAFDGDMHHEFIHTLTVVWSKDIESDDNWHLA